MIVCVCVMQKYAIDFQALSCAFAATIVPPLTSMSPHRPPLLVGVAPNFVLITMMVLLFIVSDVISLAFLCTRSWYQGGNGTADKVNPQLLHVFLGPQTYPQGSQVCWDADWDPGLIMSILVLHIVHAACGLCKCKAWQGCCLQCSSISADAASQQLFPGQRMTCVSIHSCQDVVL